MKANPGGQIDLREVIGREKIIDEIWSTLEQQSIRMTAERRIGKTTIIKKLEREPRSGWVPVFQDLEQFHTAGEFALGVYLQVEKFLSRTKKSARRVRTLLTSLGGTEIAGIIKLPRNTEVPWKALLSSAIDDLVEERAKNSDRPLFLWDEVPYMLSSIKDREGEAVAMEVLDTLRSLRQTHSEKGLRMVITGSIGVHHVLHGLKHQGYANSPLNDVYTLTVPPLTPDAATELALRLIEGEGIVVKEKQKIAAEVAKQADCFPFYIHHIVKALRGVKEEISEEVVNQLVLRHMLDPDDPWELEHYRSRIPIYYGGESEQSVLGILDGIAASDGAMSINALLKELKSTGSIEDREQLIDLLRRVEQDHYLTRNDGGHYHFQFPLLERWWCLSRGL